MTEPTSQSRSTDATTDATWGELYAERADSELPALVFSDRVITYAELTGLAAGAADWLDDAGATSGRPIAAVVSGAVEAAALTLAGSATGRPIAPLNVRSTAAEITVVLDRLAPALLVAEPDALDIAAEAAERSGLSLFPLPPPVASDRPVDFTAARLDDPVLILHTSGTTSAPKSVPYLHGRLAKRVQVNSRLLHLGEGSRYATA